MIVIGICDSNPKEGNATKIIAEKAVFSLDDMSFQLYKNGQEVLQAITNKTFSCDVLLLEINLSDMRGLEVADAIRKQQIDVDIIFVTHSTEYVFEGYTYKAFAYILKQSLEMDLARALQRYIQEKAENQGTLTVTSNGVSRVISIAGIRYIESNARQLIVHLKHEDVSFYGKLSDIEKSLTDRGFLRIHQSYLVRQALIQSYCRDSVKLGDEKLPVSRKYYEQVKASIKGE